MFYQLPEPRKGFVFFERLEHVDPATGVLKEPKDFPGHRFKYSPITASGIRGSCEHYDTRQVIAREELAAMTYQQVEARYGTGPFVVDLRYSSSTMYLEYGSLGDHFFHNVHWVQLSWS